MTKATAAAIFLLLAGVASAQDGPTAAADREQRSDVITDAAMLGDALAQFVGAMHLHDLAVDEPENPRYAESAVFWFRRAADQGLAIAQGMIGALYHDGFGPIEHDFAEAARWHRRAADQGLAMSQMALASMHAKGVGVPEDAAEAAYWFRLAAEQGNVEAQIQIAIRYHFGRGVPKDSVTAYAWLNVAAARDADAEVGDARVAEQRDLHAEFLTTDQIAEGQRLARDLWEGIERRRRAAPNPLTIQTPAPTGSASELRAKVLAAVAPNAADTRSAVRSPIEQR